MCNRSSGWLTNRQANVRFRANTQRHLGRSRRHQPRGPSAPLTTKFFLCAPTPRCVVPAQWEFLWTPAARGAEKPHASTTSDTKHSSVVANSLDLLLLCALRHLRFPELQAAPRVAPRLRSHWSTAWSAQPWRQAAARCVFVAPRGGARQVGRFVMVNGGSWVAPPEACARGQSFPGCTKAPGEEL